MKKILIILISLLALQTQAQTTHDWENPSVLSINKLPYHATLQLPSKWKECKEIVSLDGQWLFRWSRNPEERPTDFYREDYDLSNWDKIAVPGNWQLQGYGTPIYKHQLSVCAQPSQRDYRATKALDGLRESQPGRLVCNVSRCNQGDAQAKLDSAFRWCAFSILCMGEWAAGWL